MSNESGGSDGYSVEVAIDLVSAPTDDEIEQQYETVRRALHAYEDVLDPPLTVELTRRSSRTLAETELALALEVCRDAMVDVLGVPCDHPEVDWIYAQAAGSDALLVQVRPGRSHYREV